MELDPILRSICEGLQGELYKKEPGKLGKYPFKVLAMIKAHVYAKLNDAMSYKALQREMYRNERLHKALGFKKVPSHQAMSDFRKRLGKNKLDTIINHVVRIAIEMHLSSTKDIFVNSAPIKTFVNFARANKTLTFDMEKIKSLYQHLDLGKPVLKFGLEINSHFSADSLIAFKIFNELGGFISFNSAFNLVKKSRVL